MIRTWILTMVAAALGITSWVPAAVFTVDDDFQQNPGADYSTIWDAISAASDGDEILVWPGEYVETGSYPVVDVSKGLTIRSVAGPDLTIIRGNGQTAAGPEGIKVVTSMPVVIDGFSILDCVPLFGVDTTGLAIHIRNSPNVVIRNCRVSGSDCGTPFGTTVAMYVDASAVFMEFCSVTNNASMAIAGSTTMLANSTICGNSEGQVAGDVVYDESVCVSWDCNKCSEWTNPCEGTDCEPGSGATIHVPDDQPTIAAAMAVAGDCDTILIAPGTYSEHLGASISRSLTLAAAGADGSVVLAPQHGWMPAISVSGCYFADGDSFATLRLDGIVLDGNAAGPVSAVAVVDVLSARLEVVNGGLINWDAPHGVLVSSGELSVDACGLGNNVTSGPLVESLARSSSMTSSSFYQNDSPVLVRAGHLEWSDYYTGVTNSNWICCKTEPTSVQCCDDESCVNHGWADCGDPPVTEGEVFLSGNAWCLVDGSEVAALQNYNGPDCLDPYDGLGSNDCDCNGIIDAYETDCNTNGVLDQCEIDDGSALDCNGNGVPDGCDIADGAALDCDENGVPDTCENDPDCNGNGIQDECDIADGSAQDCNDNGIPDSCDIEGDSDSDCDGNGVPDACDIDNGYDCDGNGIPDACDLADGASDLDGNGVQDVCDILAGDLMDCDGNLYPDFWQRPRPRCGLDMYQLAPPPDFLADVGVADEGVIVGIIPPNTVVTWDLDEVEPGVAPVQAVSHDGCRTFEYLESWTVCPEMGQSIKMTQRQDVVMAADGIGYMKLFSIQDDSSGVSVTFEVFPGGAGDSGSPPGAEGPGDPGVPPGEDTPPVAWRLGEGNHTPFFGEYVTPGLLGRPNLTLNAALGQSSPQSGSKNSSRLGDGSGGYPGADDEYDGYKASGYPRTVDLNGDGLDDLVVPFFLPSWGESGVQWFLATSLDLGDAGNDPDSDGFPGGVQWTEPVVVLSSLDLVTTAAVGDINGDGLIEIVLGSFNSSWVEVITVNADGTARGNRGGTLVHLGPAADGRDLWGLDLFDMVGDERPELVALLDGGLDIAEVVVAEWAGSEAIRWLDNVGVIAPDGWRTLQVAQAARDGAGPTAVIAGAGGWEEPFALRVGPAGLLADLTLDGEVGIDDLLVVVELWGGSKPTADLDRDGATEIDDLLMVIEDYGSVYQAP